jgi:hypothetical protein
MYQSVQNLNLSEKRGDMSGKEKVRKVIDDDIFKTESHKIIKEKRVQIRPIGRDKYRRTIARVYDGYKSINKTMSKKLKKQTMEGKLHAI